MNLVGELAAAVKKAQTTDDLVSALSVYQHRADTEMAEIVSASTVPPACRAGCNFCCHIPVVVVATEVFAVAAFVRAEFSESQQTRLLEKLQHHDTQVMSMSAQKQTVTNIACPLLLDGRCSVYAARPLACRGYHSLDIASCEKTFQDPTDVKTRSPMIPELHEAALGIQASAIEVFEEAGFDPAHYEFSSALLIALTEETSAPRFYEGRSAFPAAKQWN